MKYNNYNPTYMTREATYSHIDAIDNEIAALADVPDYSLSYTMTEDIKRHLRALREKLMADLKYFDARDAAMAEAVK